MTCIQINHWNKMYHTKHYLSIARQNTGASITQIDNLWNWEGGQRDKGVVCLFSASCDGVCVRFSYLSPGNPTSPRPHSPPRSFLHCPFFRCTRRSSMGRSTCGSSSVGTQTTGLRSRTRRLTAPWSRWRRLWKVMWPLRLSCSTRRRCEEPPT